MTLSKLAKMAHVSVSTASKAFSMSPEVNSETREMIFQLAKEYGCFKKYYRAKYHKAVIAVICPEFDSFNYANYISVIQRILEKQNCEICVASTHFSTETEKELLEYYSNYADVDGVIAIGIQMLEKEWDFDIPAVLISSENRITNIPSVRCPIKGALREAVGEWVAAGVGDIGFIGETRTVSKRELFKDVMTEYGFTDAERLIAISDVGFEDGGYRAMSELLKTEKAPRAVVCAYNYMAIGALRCLKDNGLSVPQDVAILGMDDIPELAYFSPSLSTISYKKDEVCEVAVKLLMNALRGEYNTEEVIIDAEYRRRESGIIEKN